MKLTRRELLKYALYFSLSSFGISKLSSLSPYVNSRILVEGKLLKQINNYNLNRISSLSNNFSEQVLCDLETGHTFWSARQLYTFADYYAINKV